MSGVDELAAKVAELRGHLAAVEATMTKEDLVRNVDRWLETARAHAAGSSRLVLGGQATGENLASVLFEDRLDDDGLAGRTVARLERQGFGDLSDRAKKQRLAKVDAEIAEVAAELLAARKREALVQIEREFAGSPEAA
jgi:hypothetical protein